MLQWTRVSLHHPQGMMIGTGDYGEPGLRFATALCEHPVIRSAITRSG